MAEFDVAGVAGSVFKVFSIRAHQTAHVFTALKPDAVIRTRQLHSSILTFPRSFFSSICGLLWGTQYSRTEKERDLDHSHSCTNIRHNIRTFIRNSRVATRHPTLPSLFPCIYSADASTVTLHMSILQSLSSYFKKRVIFRCYFK